MSAVETERVLVVPTSEFHAIGHFQGICQDVDRYLDRLLSPQYTSYRPRSEMETDPSFKQLIPYVIFRHTDELGISRLFQYTRGSGQGEKRLHAKRSIGIGGHISAIDSNEADPYLEGMRRELEEEVFINTAYQANCVGLLNDDDTEVGRVHLGVVHLFDVDEPRVAGREDDIADASFSTLPELFAAMDEFESWSQICLQSIFGSANNAD